LKFKFKGKLLKSSLYYFLLHLFFSGNAYAEINCETLPPSSGIGSLNCYNGNNKTQTIVTFREMPSWDTNASLLVVQMCQYPLGSFQESTSSSVPAEILTPENFTNKEPISCLRRYCTQNLEHFSFEVSNIPIPITGGFVLGISFGFSKSNFQVNCQPIEENEI
jgi:hypothetical protein